MSRRYLGVEVRSLLHEGAHCEPETGEQQIDRTALGIVSGHNAEFLSTCDIQCTSTYITHFIPTYITQFKTTCIP